jgi:hypothetical protein
MKEFRSDIENLFDLIKNKKKFAFSKYADGEYKILINQPITNCDGWKFDPKKNLDEQKLLSDSFKYEHEDYYVGISCPCCQPKKHVDWMRKNVGSKNVTWANLFVNSNYDFFVDNFFPEFNNWDGSVILFANENGINNKLPFKVDKYIPLKLESWKNPHLEELINLSKNISDEKEGQLFLFSAGPLGNMLSYTLHLHNKNNTYIDIGSTINPWIVGNNRSYLKGNNNKTCTW